MLSTNDIIGYCGISYNRLNSILYEFDCLQIYATETKKYIPNEKLWFIMKELGYKFINGCYQK